MSDQGHGGGKKGRGRGKKRGRGRGQRQQQQQQQSVPGGLQERREEQEEATALPEQPPQKKQQPKDVQHEATAMPEQRLATQEQPQQAQKQAPKRQQQQPVEEQYRAMSAQEHQPSTQQQSRQGRKARQKKQQPQPREEQQGARAMLEQHPPTQQKPKDRHEDQADGIGPSKQQHMSLTISQEASGVSTIDEVTRSISQLHLKGSQPPDEPKPLAQQQSPMQPPTQPQSSKGAAKLAPAQQPQSTIGTGMQGPSITRSTPPQSQKAVPRLPHRPDGGGRSGRPIRLRANFLPVKLPTNDIHHYDSDIREKGKKSGEGYTKSESPKIIQAVVKLYESENPSGPKLVFDRNGKNIYCRQLIPGIDKGPKRYNIKFTTDNGKQKDFIIDVKWVSLVSLYYLKEALEGRLTDIPYDTMQAIEVVLQQMPKMKTIQIRSSFFDYPTGREKDLGGGIQVWNGTFVSIRPTQWKMMLNVDTCATGFYKGQPVLDFLCEFLGFRDYPRNLSDAQRKKFAKEMKVIKVETTHMKRKQKCSGLSARSAKDESFECEGRRVSVLSYFKDKYGINLKYPDLPCIKIGQKGSLIPMELCNVIAGQKKQGKLTGAQTQQMIRHTAIPAPDRMQKIMDLIRKLRYENDPYIRDFGISIGNEMVDIHGRVLEPPPLMYGPANRPGKEIPRDGSWKITKKMLDPIDIKEWAVISYMHDQRRGGGGGRYRGPQYLDDRGIDNFIYYLVEVGREKGVHVNDNPCYVGTEQGFHGTNKLFGNLKAKNPNLQLIVVVLPVNGDDVYEEVKHCGDVVHGITTQCITVEKASDDFSDWRRRETLVNLWLKINAKLGGTTCALDKSVKSPILQRPVIIFGMLKI